MKIKKFLFAIGCLLMSCAVLASSGGTPKLPAATPLERLIASFDEEGLERLVGTLPPGQGQELAVGVVASRTNHSAAADSLLTRVLQARSSRVYYAAIAESTWPSMPPYRADTPGPSRMVGSCWRPAARPCKALTWLISRSSY